MIIVSTDGSCLRNPGGAIGWAWVNHEGGSGSGGAAAGTNQVAELRAVFEAIVAHHDTEPLLIESDSLYAIKCASEWLSSWRLNGWRTATGGPVKNVELVRHIDHAIATRPGPVRFRWVRGHVGNYFNEQADKLAGEAARAAAPDPAAPATGISDLPPLPEVTVAVAPRPTPLPEVTVAVAPRPKRVAAAADSTAAAEADALTLF
ncbi:ribonuclease H family protein [Nocardia sp. NPDC003482]